MTFFEIVKDLSKDTTGRVGIVRLVGMNPITFEPNPPEFLIHPELQNCRDDWMTVDTIGL